MVLDFETDYNDSISALFDYNETIELPVLKLMCIAQDSIDEVQPDVVALHHNLPALVCDVQPDSLRGQLRSAQRTQNPWVMSKQRTITTMYLEATSDKLWYSTPERPLAAEPIACQSIWLEVIARTQAKEALEAKEPEYFAKPMRRKNAGSFPTSRIKCDPLLSHQRKKEAFVLIKNFFDSLARYSQAVIG